MVERACKDCRRVVEDETECPVCKNNDLSESFSGTVVIYDPDSSEIAEKLEVATPGRYAVRVR